LILLRDNKTKNINGKIRDNKKMVRLFNKNPFDSTGVYNITKYNELMKTVENT